MVGGEGSMHGQLGGNVVFVEQFVHSYLRRSVEKGKLLGGKKGDIVGCGGGRLVGGGWCDDRRVQIQSLG